MGKRRRSRGLARPRPDGAYVGCCHSDNRRENLLLPLLAGNLAAFLLFGTRVQLGHDDLDRVEIRARSHGIINHIQACERGNAGTRRRRVRPARLRRVPTAGAAMARRAAKVAEVTRRAPLVRSDAMTAGVRGLVERQLRGLVGPWLGGRRSDGSDA